MQLAYDFDLFSIIPDSVQAEFQAQFNKLGMAAQMSEQVALFRDKRTAAALKSADQTVQQFFLDAGFGMNVYSSGAPAGRFLARDEVARFERIAKLGTLMIERQEELRAADWGQFSLTHFLETNQAATPIDERELYAMHLAAHRKGQRRKALAKTGLIFGCCLTIFAAASTMR